MEIFMTLYDKFDFRHDKSNQTLHKMDSETFSRIFSLYTN